MKYVSTQDLETGNEIVDKQHKALIEAFNSLLDASMKGYGRQELGQTINFLVEYTKKHFSDEEDLQVRYRYPDYKRHKKLHDDFNVTVQELCGKLMEEGPTLSLLGRVNREMGDWLISHIKGEDKILAEYIKKYT